MKLFFRLTLTLSIMVTTCCLLTSSTQADCVQCEALPPDCQPGKATPFSGGPPCTCLLNQAPQGCVLKPCQFVDQDEICDCSLSNGSVQNRQFCRKYRCSGNSGQCESCRALPPDCTMNSYSNPPANGGPDCSCANQMAPGGCTMKPCSGFGPDPCVSKPGGKSGIFLFGATCPGSFDQSGGGGGGGKSGAALQSIVSKTMIGFIFMCNFIFY